MYIVGDSNVENIYYEQLVLDHVIERIFLLEFALFRSHCIFNVTSLLKAPIQNDLYFFKL